MQNSLISIIIPVYNAEKYIERCLESLLTQTYSNIEILCIDDCSKDNSLNILKKIKEQDNRIKLYQLGQNCGPATARNIGLEHACGEYIMFCDNDDTYAPNMCEQMLTTMITENTDIVTCQANIHNSFLNPIMAKYANCNPLGTFVLLPKYKKSINVFLWNKIFKKSIIDQYNIKFPDGVTSEDNAFITKYLTVTDKYCGIQEKYYNYFFRKTSFTLTKKKKNIGQHRFDRLAIIKDVYKHIEAFNLLQRENIFFKKLILDELEQLFIFNKDINSKKYIIAEYNKFIADAKLLEYNEYCFEKLSANNKKKNKIVRAIMLLIKCKWI